MGVPADPEARISVFNPLITRFGAATNPQFAAVQIGNRGEEKFAPRRRTRRAKSCPADRDLDRPAPVKRPSP
jgi:hypothetical protein